MADFTFTRASGDLTSAADSFATTNTHLDLPKSSDFSGARQVSHLISVSVFQNSNDLSDVITARQDFIRAIFPEGFDINDGANLMFQPADGASQEALRQATGLTVAMHKGGDVVHLEQTNTFLKNQIDSLARQLLDEESITAAEARAAYDNLVNIVREGTANTDPQKVVFRYNATDPDMLDAAVKAGPMDEGRRDGRSLWVRPHRLAVSCPGARAFWRLPFLGEIFWSCGTGRVSLGSACIYMYI